MNDNMKLFRNESIRDWSPVQRVGGKRYMPGLDGLRALSVLAVIAYHLNLKWAQGGLIGVGIFFVISGYLITDQIMNEWTTYRRLNLLNFWLRRARRLLPAMIGMLLFVVLWLLCIDSNRLLSLKGDFLSSLLYVNNWWLIFHKVSYFQSFGPPSPIGHLWSLSIEEQFYAIWPLLLVFGLKIAPRRGRLTLWILAIAAVSALAMAMVYTPGTDPSRVYYGTDTRAFALLIGAALAVVWPSRKLGDSISGAARIVLDMIGGVGLIALVVLIFRTNEYDESLYQGGFVLISVISAAVIAVLAHPASLLGKMMGAKPLRWIGVRSYSLYIWHYPVIILTTPEVDTGGMSISRILFQLVMSIILASLSFTFIEEPLRRGSFRPGRGKGNIRIGTRRRRFRTMLLAAIVTPALLVLLVWSTSPSKVKPPRDVVQAAGAQDHAKVKEESSNEESSHDQERDESKQGVNHESESASPTVVEHNLAPEEEVKPLSLGVHSGKGITAIGDSVILDAAPFLDKMLPGIVVDGKVGRQMSQANDVIDRLRAKGKLGDRIIIELGTNGPFNKKQLRKLLHSLRGAKQIILVNTRVPRNWQNTVNEDITEVANDFSNTSVVDWYSASEGKDDFFYRDGVHLKRGGAEYYASLLAKAIIEKVN